MKTRRLLGASFALAVAIALLASASVPHVHAGPGDPVDRATTVELADDTACGADTDPSDQASLHPEIRSARSLDCGEAHATTLLQSFLHVSMNGPQGP